MKIKQFMKTVNINEVKAALEKYLNCEISQITKAYTSDSTIKLGAGSILDLECMCYTEVKDGRLERR